MTDKTVIGRSVRSMEAQEFEPYSRVVVYDSNGNRFESGDGSGKTFYLENPFASQAVADRLAQNIIGFAYQPYKAQGAMLNPAAEIGDAISIHGLYSSIFQEDSSYGPQYAANIGAPGEEDLNHENPYISPTDRKIIRLNASAGRLRAAIKKETEDRLFDSKQIKASITGLNEYIGTVEAGLDSYVLATDFNETLGQYQTIIASNELAAKIDDDIAGLSQRVTHTNTELETVRTASNNLYAALGVEYNEDGSVKTIEAIASLDEKTSVTVNELGTIKTASNRLYAALNVEKNPDGTIKSIGALAELNQQVETVKSENQTITTAITKIENVVGDASSGLVMRVTQAENGIKTNASSITKLTTKIGNLETGLSLKIGNDELEEKLKNYIIEADLDGYLTVKAAAEMYVTDGDVTAAIGAYIVTDANGNKKALAAILADQIKLQGRVDLTGSLSVQNGVVTSTGQIVSQKNIRANTGLSSTKLELDTSDITIAGKKYTPIQITSTSGTVLVLGTA